MKSLVVLYRRADDPDQTLRQVTTTPGLVLELTRGRYPVQVAVGDVVMVTVVDDEQEKA